MTQPLTSYRPLGSEGEILQSGHQHRKHEMKERVEFAVDACVPGWQASVWEARIEDLWEKPDHLHFLRVRTSLRNRGIQHAVIIVLK